MNYHVFMTNSPPTAPEKKPRRRWWSFSLRTLMIFMLVVGVGFGCFRWAWRAKLRERAAVKALEEKGASVSYDYQWDRGPAWVRRVLGDDWFAEVVGITGGDEFADEDMKLLKEFHVQIGNWGESESQGRVEAVVWREGVCSWELRTRTTGG